LDKRVSMVWYVQEAMSTAKKGSRTRDRFGIGMGGEVGCFCIDTVEGGKVESLKLKVEGAVGKLPVAGCLLPVFVLWLLRVYYDK
jgi:hypothetical protein